MDAVTYPDPDVQKLFGEHFVGLKIDLLARHPDYKTATLGQRVIWSPAMIFTDASHREIRRYVGWLPAQSFRAELSFVVAMAAFNRGQFEPARDGFGQLLETFAGSEIEAEALYWHGIAGFLAAGKDFAVLKQSWQRLARDFAGTRWATHASVIEHA